MFQLGDYRGLEPGDVHSFAAYLARELGAFHRLDATVVLGHRDPGFSHEHRISRASP